jgi:hypothetical protein
MTPVRRFFALAAALTLASTTVAQATPLSSEAVDNATVQPAGPRSGTSGKAFFNVEGSANGTFASYGVADFQFGSLPNPVIGINSASLVLVQSNAAFSATGDVVLSLDKKSPLSDIQPGGTSPLAFDGVDPGTGADVGAGDLDLLAIGGGPFTYTVGVSGNVDSYALSLDAATETEIINRLNAVGTIRIVVGTGSAGVAATWAGATNSTYAGPTLALDVEYEIGVPTVSSTWGKIKASYR